MAGRPTGYSAGANEHAWKQAVREAFSGCVLPTQCRVQVEVDFVLAPDQVGRVEPDLDNLIKSTVDALEGVLGERSGTGARVEADDVRVDRIVASKRAGRTGEHPARGSWCPSCPKSRLTARDGHDGRLIRGDRDQQLRLHQRRVAADLRGLCPC